MIDSKTKRSTEWVSAAVSLFSVSWCVCVPADRRRRGSSPTRSFRELWRSWLQRGSKVKVKRRRWTPSSNWWKEKSRTTPEWRWDQQILTEIKFPPSCVCRDEQWPTQTTGPIIISQCVCVVLTCNTPEHCQTDAVRISWCVNSENQSTRTHLKTHISSRWAF